MTLRADGHVAPLKTVTLALPRTLTVRRGAKAQRVPGKAAVRIRPHVVGLTLPGTGAAKVKLTLPRGTIAADRSLRRGAPSVSLRATLVFADTSRAHVRRVLAVGVRH